MKNVSLFRKMGYVLSLILCCVIISCTVEHSDDSSKISIKESDISSLDLLFMLSVIALRSPWAAWPLPA